ncbi:MFS transporter [Nocardioides sp. GY 10127]|uniref:MFS transporter n=1 Tax=Nocardioides sp. GY 10127 TaxID=2569762 RepID=UPI001F11664A|nr:MFS transporter [Nocardioides sp. GY 10127]
MTDDYVPHPHRWRILCVSLVIGFMALLDVSIVNVALPSMSSGLGASEGEIQWVVSGYALTFGLTLVAGGRLGDAYGRRRMMLIGITAFVLSSAAVGFAPTTGTVVLARLVQGASAGLLTPQNSGLIQVLFRGRERAQAFGVFGMTVASAQALGPVIGGLIIAVAGSASGWRWVFWVNIPIGVIGLLGVLLLVPRVLPRKDRPDPRIDVLGALLLGVAVVCLLYPVVSLESDRYLPLVMLVGVPLGLWAFVRWEARVQRLGRPPLLDLRLLQGLPGYVNGLAVGALYFTGYVGFMLVVSLHLQEALGYSALQAGLTMMPFAVGAAVAAPIAGRFVTDLGRVITVAALSVLMLGVLAVAVFVQVAPTDRLWLVILPALLIGGIGSGAVVSPNMALTLAEVPPAMGGAAGAAVQTGQRMGQAIGSALAVSVYGIVGSRLTSEDGVSAALVVEALLLCAALAMAVHAKRQASAA